MRTFSTVLSAHHHLGGGWSTDLLLPISTVAEERLEDEPDLRLSGFGDLALGLRYDLATLWGAGAGRPTVGLRAGLRLPTGTQALFESPDFGVAPEVMALGSAAFGASLDLDVSWRVTPSWALSAMVQGREPLNRNPAAILHGQSLGWGMNLLWFPDPRLHLRAGLSGLWMGSSHHGGKGRIESSGGAWNQVEAGAGAQLGGGAYLSIRARRPLYIDVHGRQITETWSVGTFFGLTFLPDAPEAPAAPIAPEAPAAPIAPGAKAEPQAMPEPEPLSGDVIDSARGGESFVLAELVAPGRISVVDFWAEWCAPCKVISRDLAALAATDPRLAVRKVEVPDFESPVYREHLEGVPGLPVIWILGPRGQRLLALQGAQAAPERVLEATRAALRSLTSGDFSSPPPPRPSPEPAPDPAP